MAQIDAYAMERERWIAIGAKCTQSFGENGNGGGGTKTDNRIEKAAMMMLELSQKIEAEMELAINDRDMIIETIRNKSKKQRYAELLEWRFIGGLSNYKISNRINKDVKTIQRIMRKAIDNLDL